MEPLPILSALSVLLLLVGLACLTLLLVVLVRLRRLSARTKSTALKAKGAERQAALQNQRLLDLRRELEALNETIQGAQGSQEAADKKIRRQVTQTRNAAEMAMRRTRLVHNLLQPVSWATAPLLITGCGRSGTHFMSAALRSLRLDVEHEVPAADVTVSWIHAPPAYREEQGLTFSCILHQHREPLASISSILTFHERSWKHVERFLPQCLDPDPVARAAKYWLYWNRLAEEQASWSYSVERIGEQALLERFAEETGLALTGKALEAGRKQQNSRQKRSSYREVAWSDLAACLSPQEFEALGALAERYGYPGPEGQAVAVSDRARA